MTTLRIWAWNLGYKDRLLHIRLNPYVGAGYKMSSKWARLWSKGWCHADLECLDGWDWSVD
jgi:hypothetical protein